MAPELAETKTTTGFWLRCFVAVGVLAVSAHCNTTQAREDAKFSYENLYQDKYKRGNGGIIPITIERGESYSGSITADQRYLYFASNTSGNYDIFLRDLEDVFSIPVVSTVTNQREPSISPNGKYLVYVDDELDPDGDIILLKVNPKKLIELFRERRQPDDEWFAARAVNLTNSEKNRIRARDANPVWSPDGKFIAYSSDLVAKEADDLGAGAGAIQNIWVMPLDNPEQKRQVTTKGGVMPAFSPDGLKIVYISYEDENSFGAVYELELSSGKTQRITSGQTLDFYPTYLPDGKGFVLTRIAADTNGDGQVDRKDAGQIIKVYPDEDAPLDADDFIPLTSPSDHVFDSRVSGFVGGSVVLAQLKGEDVNVGFMPLSGAIPAKPDVRQQQQYLAEVAKRSKNKARTCMGLQQLPAAYENAPDVVVYDALSSMRRARCDTTAAKDLTEYIATGPKDEAAIYRLFNDLAAMSPDYVDLRGVLSLEPLASRAEPADYFEEVLRNKKIWQFYRDQNDNVEYLAVLSFIRHEQTLFYLRQGKLKEARETLRKMMRENPRYLALDELLLETGKLDSSTLPAAELVFLLSDDADLGLLESYELPAKTTAPAVRPHVRRASERFLQAFFDRQYTLGNEEAQEQFLEGFAEKKHKMLHALFALATARDDASGELYDDSDAAANRVKQLVAPGSVYHFYASGVLAENTGVRSGIDASVKIYSEAISAYRDEDPPENVRDIIERISTYYKDRAEQHRAAGEFRSAAREYQALLDLYLSAHANRMTKELARGELLDYALNLDQIALRISRDDEDLLEDILRFYDSRIDTARRYLVTEFIFGRGFLRAQLGIQLHLDAERDGLGRSEKKQVFEYFRKAEVDMNWCFFTNARFADAYIMLGWMYQFIDEKREVVLEAGSGKRDREVFESLYRAYFPDYLFEKNIRLYQKTLALFGNSGSPRIRNSFHLNIANNYFLLNNYSQAEEHYAAILDKKGNPDYQFENPEQEMMFFYHLGRTLYFTGKYDAASRYLRYVENNLNSRYPLAGVPAETQRLNQGRRETAYKTFALNAEYSQNIATAIAYHQTIIAERASVVAETPVSMSHLELARLHLAQGDLTASLHDTQNAEAALAKEEEIAIPKFKIRIKWFWVYEPWTWLIGLIYKLPYDNVYIGENHLAFELPTVNRYQLLYSIRAEIYRSKGLLHEASNSLAKLVEYAEKDKTKHGAETLSSAVSRRAELEFSLRSWDSAQKLYEAALKQAEKNGNAGAALTFRKNIELCKLRRIETREEPVSEKIKSVRSYINDIEEYEKEVADARIKAARKIVKEKDDPNHPDLTEAELTKIRSAVHAELQPLLFFKGLYAAHDSEMVDFAERISDRTESFDQFLARKQETFNRHKTALKYFRGYSRESFEDVLPEFEPDLKNNSLRIKLAMNRAKILQDMSLFDESGAEFKEIQERSQEFRAQLEYAIAMYRAFRVQEEAGFAEKVNLAPYRQLVAYFRDNPGFLRPNTDLFDRLVSILVERALQQKNFAEAMQLEDAKRQALALPLYFDDLKFLGTKDDKFNELLIVEQRRTMLAAQIKSARLARQGVQVPEKQLAALDADASRLRALLLQRDRLDYRYETFFASGYSQAELQGLAAQGLIYVMKPREDIVFLSAKGDASKKGSALRFEMQRLSKDADITEELEKFAEAQRARVIVLAAPVLNSLLKSEKLSGLSLQTTIISALNFRRNTDPARRNLLQINRNASFFSLGGSNEVDYKAAVALQRVHTSSEAETISIHKNIIDYEAELARKTIVIDNALLNPAGFFGLKGNPNYAIASFQARDKLSLADEFLYATAADLYFSAMGVGKVLHTRTSRKQAQPLIEAFLTQDQLKPAALVTGNVEATGNSEREAASLLQRKLYFKKIGDARAQREYEEAISYAEDAISLRPDDVDLRLTAAELLLIQRDYAAAARHIEQIRVTKQSPLNERRAYARILMRAGMENELIRFLGADGDATASVLKNETEFRGVSQLTAFNTGNLEPLTRVLPWQPRSTRPGEDSLHFISKTLKDVELRNEICLAATEALEFKLVIDSCLNNPRADSAEQADRDRIRSFLAGAVPDTRINVRPEDLDFNHALSLLQSGYAADAVFYARRVLVAQKLNNSEHLLAYSLLRVLARRKLNSEDSAAVAKLLTEYGSKALPKAGNLQVARFYRILSLLEKVLAGKADALSALTPLGTRTSGVVSSENLLYLLTASVAGSLPAESVIQDSRLEIDSRIEADLAFFLRNRDTVVGELNCTKENCDLLAKAAIVSKDNASALRLLLALHGVNSTAILPDGAYGYSELFTDELYLWHQSGAEVRIERIDAFDEKAVAKMKSGRRYLVHLPQRNLFLRRKINPPREAILIDASVGPKKPASESKPSVQIAAPEPATLYSALQARWGGQKKAAERLTVQIKPPFNGAPGDLHIYTQTLSLDSLEKLRPNGYHLVCLKGESYNNFAIFALTLVENMIAKKQTVEAAYDSALKSQKGKQASTRPLYYLYRN